MSIGALTLGQVASTHNHLFCCCKPDSDPVIDENAGGQAFKPEPAPARPPGVNPFLRVRPPVASDSTSQAIEALAEDLASSGYQPYTPDRIDEQLADQFARTELAARQAIFQNSTNLPSTQPQAEPLIDEAEALAIMIGLGLFDNDDCCC